MHYSKAVLATLGTAALGVQAQYGYGYDYGYDTYYDVAPRSFDDSEDLFEAVYARDADADADPEPEFDHDTHFLITRDLHARVAELEDILLYARTDEDKKKKKTQPFKMPTVPAPGTSSGRAAKTIGKGLEVLTKGTKEPKKTYPTPKQRLDEQKKSSGGGSSGGSGSK